MLFHKTLFIKVSSNEKTSRSYNSQYQKKLLKKEKKRQKKLKKAENAAQKRKQTELVYIIYTTITHHFPELLNWMREIDDCRKKASPYELATHLTACLAMFLFKSGSRNGYNNLRKDLQFQQNYEKLFKLPMPHGDSVHNVIESLDESQLEILKQKMVQVLLARKTFHKSRYLNKWFRVAVDGSGAVSYKYKHSAKCLHKTSKNGITSYFYSVLEARLVTPNGFSISLATEWIENPEGEYDKQDCERKAFKRLAAKLKKSYPRLPIIILADGLYPYEGFFAICELNQWAYQCTFKEGNLKTIWDEVQGLSAIGANKTHRTSHYEPTTKDCKKQIVRAYQWINDIDYNGRRINWLQCHEVITWTKESKDGVKEEKSKEATFVHITNLVQDGKIIEQASSTGRLRWKIENEGFNTLKNGGYGMEHKWARKSYQGLKNYFQFMQMAYLINQLVVKRTSFQEEYLHDANHPTLMSIWSDLIAAMKWAKLKAHKLSKILDTKIQFRFVT